MRLPDDTRLRASSHEKPSAPSGVLAMIMQAFGTLHRIAWSAPWAEERR
ncbi:hypothetical protein [Sphingobium sp.]|nr:hypothetical protein [Sphingobium sp.]